MLRVEAFAKGFAHGFVVRSEGTEGPLFRPGPVPREAIMQAVGLPKAKLHLAKQVHGGDVVTVPAGDGSDGPPACDALVTRTAGHVVGVATADCLPILIAGAAGACAAVHAGWRGLLAGVIEHAVAAVREPSGRTAAASLQAAIGPAIGPCCFEVGPEVAAAFADRFGPEGGGAAESAGGSLSDLVRSTPGMDRSFVDLPQAAVRILMNAGLPRSSIHFTGLCTRCGPAWLESYRRDGKWAGRLLSVIGPEAVVAP